MNTEEINTEEINTEEIDRHVTIETYSVNIMYSIFALVTVSSLHTTSFQRSNSVIV